MHPEADLVLRAPPETEYISLVLLRGNDPEKVVDTCLDDGKVEREDDDEDEGEDTAEYTRCGSYRIAEYVAKIESLAHRGHDVVS